MTIHIALVCNSFVLVVGDRLLTVPGEVGRQPWDPAANKTIYVETANGRVVVSYAGLAYIRQPTATEPTDEWLLRTLTQIEPVPPFRQGMGHPTYVGPVPRITVGDVFSLISEAVDSTFPLLPPEDRANGLEVMVCGWTWPRDVNRSNAQPSTILRQFGYLPGGDADWISTPRRRYRNISTGWDIASIGAGSNALLRRITDQLRDRNTTQDDVEATIVNAVRDAAIPGSGIGRNLTSIFLPIYGEPRVRYFRDHADEIAFTPAFVLRGGIYYPQVLQGQLPEIQYAEDGWIRIEVVPPFSSGNHTSSMGSQGRPPLN